MGLPNCQASAISLRGVGLERHQPLPIDLMLIWPHQPASEVTERVFPFAGATTLGDDVAWSGEVQLQSGRIDVFSASLDSLGERALIASTQLLRGDRVDLEAGLGKPLPKGFLHVQRAGDAPSSTMHAVVFGSAESVKVVRYGDAGYRVAPGWWAQLTHHPYFSTLLLLLVALTAYLASYKDVLELLTHWGWRREAASKRSTDGL